MLGRGVANVLCEAPARMQSVRVTHVAVARDLGDDRRRRDRRAGGVAVDDRALRALEFRNREAVDQAHHFPGDAARHGDDRGAQGCQVGPVQAAGVDPADAARDHRDAGRGAQHAREQLLARLLGVLLGVVERCERTQIRGGERLVVEQHAGRHQRPRQRTATGLIRAGHQPHAEAPVEGEQPPAAAAAAGAATGARGGRLRLLGGARRIIRAHRMGRPRGSRSGPAASRSRTPPR